MAFELLERQVGSQGGVGGVPGEVTRATGGGDGVCGSVQVGQRFGAEVLFGGGAECVVVGVRRVGQRGDGVGQVVDGAGRRGVGAVSVQDPGEQVDGSGWDQRVAGGDGVVIAVARRGQVQVVGDPAAGHRHVQELSGLGAGGDGVGDVGGDALGGVHGGGVAEADVGGDVVGGQVDSPAGGVMGDGQAGLGGDGADRPSVAVLDPVGAGDRDPAVVGAGEDDVADGSLGPVGQVHADRSVTHVTPVAFAARRVRRADGATDECVRGTSGGEPVEAGARVQVGGQLPGGGQHDGVQSGGPVGGPGLVGVVDGGGGVADVDAVVVGVVADRRRVALA